MKPSKFIVRGILRVLVLFFFCAIITAVVIAVAEAADDCTVVVVAGVFHGNIFNFGGWWSYEETPEGFPDFHVHSKQSSQSCFVEIIHCRYGH